MIRDVVCAVVVYKLGWLIDPFVQTLVQGYGLPATAGNVVKWSLWALYWHWQGVILAGWWCMAHEAGHGTLSSYSWFNHVVGFTLHTVSTSYGYLRPISQSSLLFPVHFGPLLCLEVLSSCAPQGDDVCGA